MKPSAVLLRSAALALVRIGYARGRFVAAIEWAGRLIAPGRRWKALDLGAVIIEVPTNWGDVEVGPDGFVVHNRPTSARVDGDAVWYSSAIELHIGSAGQRSREANAAMAYRHRIFASPSGEIGVTLAVAHGVGATQRKAAIRIFEQVRARFDRDLVGSLPSAAASNNLRPLAHRRVAVIAAPAFRANPTHSEARP